MASLAEQLRAAASAGQRDKVQELCQTGARIDPDQEGRTALHLAAAKGHAGIVKILIDAGAKVNTRDVAGYSCLHQAATEGHEEVVLLLLKNGCLVDTQDELHGNTALHEAAWKGYSRTVEALCKYKANVYIKNNGGFTPLHLACQNGHNQCCRILLLSACKPDVRNSYGDTPLHTAARYGHAGVLRILISAFCNVNETNKNGDTSLHISAAMGRRKLTKILLEAGCDQKLKNNQDETAHDIAERKGFIEIVEILDNPPVTFIPVLENEKKSRKDQRKHDKESGTSQESSSKGKKEKHRKTKKGHKVHFSVADSKKEFSPYGCHLYPNPEFFPAVKLKSLPAEPLKKGEQYYADLAGNIKKGPRGLGYVCYCAPFFNHVEKKLDKNKQELMNHIDSKSKDLKAKIYDLEQRTHSQLFSLNQKVKESLALERIECSERLDRRILRERHEIQNHQEDRIQSLHQEIKSWVKLKQEESSSSCKNNMTETEELRWQMQNNFILTRSKSADLLSESNSHKVKPCIEANSDANKLCVNVKYSGAKPKYDMQVSQRTSKGKYENFSALSRDSRSEGDLTCCHIEICNNNSMHTDSVPPDAEINKKSPDALNTKYMKHHQSYSKYLSESEHFAHNNDNSNVSISGTLWNQNQKISALKKIENAFLSKMHDNSQCEMKNTNTHQHVKHTGVLGSTKKECEESNSSFVIPVKNTEKYHVLSSCKTDTVALQNNDGSSFV